MRERPLDRAHRVHHALSVAVRRVDGEHVDIALGELLGALEEIAGGPDGRAHTEPSMGILGGARIFQLLLNVLDGDESLEHVLVVDHQQLFDAMAVQDLLRLLERGADRDGDQVLLGHHFGDWDVGAGLKSQIAIGEDADQLAVLGHRHARDPVAPHDFERIGYFLVGRDGHRVDDHPALTALDAVDLLGLAVDGHVAMDDADAPLLGERDRQVRFGHGVHRGAEDRDVQGNLAGEAGASIGLGREHVAERRLKDQIVEGESLRDGRRDHTP